jgi:electron transport complex protein RnfC
MNYVSEGTHKKMKIYSFPHGGITFEDPTAPGKDNVIDSFLPAVSIIKFGEGSKKGYPVVQIGENVREGMVIAKALESENETVNIHATVPGKVIRKISWKNRDDFNNDALVIKLEGVFEKLGKKNEIFPWNGLTGYDLQKIISEYGIVEMENSGRPLSEMISSIRKNNNKTTLVIRCVFDDPWLAADYALCKDRIGAVIEGASIVAKACHKVSMIIIAVSNQEKELGQMLLSEAGKLDIPSAVVLTGSKYPQRRKRELELVLDIYAKKEGYNLGSYLILGPSVLAAAYDAVVLKKPILERYVAVGGSAVKHPQIMKVRIGTRIGELIEQCGGFTGKLGRIITGSVLSGKEIKYLDEPVEKTCYAIVALSKIKKEKKLQNCINCGECRAVCPAGLDPQNIYKRINANNTGNIITASCHGCGCCKIICPSDLPLSETIFGNRELISD